MLAIRLQRIGRKKQPLYRVVVSENTKDMYGNHLEILGQYNPHSKEAILKADRIKYWVSKGAQVSASISNLLTKEGILVSAKKKAVSISKKRAAKKAVKDAENKAKEAVVSEPKVEESADNAPAEEVKAETTENKEETK
ncbi:MAG: 30S ribosomal protein S16 [Patescibacteria group bacterium]|jgi:small subunit ribosomal protein S16